MPRRQLQLLDQRREGAFHVYYRHEGRWYGYEGLSLHHARWLEKGLRRRYTVVRRIRGTYEPKQHYNRALGKRP